MDEGYLKLSAVLLDYSLQIKKGEFLIINCDDAGLEYAKTVAYCAIKKGAEVFLHLDSSDLKEYRLKFIDTEKLPYVSEGMIGLYSSANAVLYIRGSNNIMQFAAYPDERVAALGRARSAVTAEVMKNTNEGKSHWCLTQAPVHSQAREAGISLEGYREFLLKACGISEGNDPVVYWKNIEKEQDRIIAAISGYTEYRVKGSRTDLTLSIKGRKWINSCGRTNFPSGEIYTSPVEDSVNGHIYFDFPVTYSGKLIEGIYLEIKNGEINNAVAEKNQNFLYNILNMDKGSRFFGEFAFGNNYGIDIFTNNMLFDEKIGGTMHMAIGSSYAVTGGQNKSDIHLDIVKDMRQSSEVYADGKLIYMNGKFIFNGGENV